MRALRWRRSRRRKGTVRAEVEVEPWVLEGPGPCERGTVEVLSERRVAIQRQVLVEESLCLRRRGKSKVNNDL